MKISVPLLLILGSFAVLSSCEKEEVPADAPCSEQIETRNGRILGYDILDLTESGDFNLNHGIASGVLKSEFIQLLQPWNAFEDQSPGVYDGEAVQLFGILNNFAASAGTKLSLIITPIDIPGRFLPSYLGEKKLNDPEVIAAFNDLIDRLFHPATGVVDPEHVIALSVGNEVDHYNWSANNDQPSEYAEFLAAIKPKINAYGIPLHVTATLYGLDDDPDRWMELLNTVDKVSVTYYPIRSDFTVRSADVACADFDSFFSKIGDKQIFIQEVGYPSSATLNSSEALQAEFFETFFSAWDTYKDQISHVSILRLNDVSLASAQATAVTYGVLGNEAFIEYIRSLGIRTWADTGTDKRAFSSIISELNKRDW